MITAGLRRADHRVHLLEVEAALEDAEPVKHLLAIGREEVVTPRDRAFERPLTRGCVARSASGQWQTRREAVADDSRRQRCDPGGRKLDAERQVIKQVTDLRDDFDVCGPCLPSDADGAGAVDEQRGAQLDQWRDRELVLAGDTKRCAACDDDPTGRRGVHDRRNLVGRRQQVLHVVEDQDHRAIGNERQHSRGSRPFGSIEDPDPVGDRSPDLVGAVQPSQADEPRTIPEPRFEEASSLDREARLADPAGTGERHQAGVLR